MSWFSKTLSFSPAKWLFNALPADTKRFLGFGGVDDATKDLANQSINRINDTVNQNNQLFSQYNDKLQDLYKRALDNLNSNKQDVSGQIDQANQDFNRQAESQNAYLANMGYTPDSNDVFNRANASLQSQRVNTLQNIRNQANQQMYNNRMQAFNFLNGLNNQQYQFGHSNLLGNQQLFQNGINQQMKLNDMDSQTLAKGLSAWAPILGAITKFAL